jgi:hypothetical protein
VESTGNAVGWRGAVWGLLGRDRDQAKINAQAAAAATAAATAADGMRV